LGFKPVFQQIEEGGFLKDKGKNGVIWWEPVRPTGFFLGEGAAKGGFFFLGSPLFFAHILKTPAWGIRNSVGGQIWGAFL